VTTERGARGTAEAREPERLALFSDVHGNRLALEAVLADIAARGISRAHCLGDLVGYGPDPNGVIDVMRDRGIPSLLGNYDEGVGWETGDCGCFYADKAAEAVGKASYAYTVAEVTAECKAYLRGLPRKAHLALGDKRVHLVHGSPRRINEYLLSDRDQRTYERLASTEPDDVLAFGHTHQSWQRSFVGVLFVNVGSVGRPKEGDPRAGYAVLTAAATDVQVEFARVAYDTEAMAAAVLAAGLPASVAETARTGRQAAEARADALGVLSSPRDYARGKVTVNVEPTPTVLWTSTRPPWLSATWRTMLSPRPVPPVSLDRALSTL
jgi:predicted phosphodiesterase